MDSCQCEGIRDYYDEEKAKERLEDYRQKGPDKTTQILIDALIAEGVKGKDF